MGSPNRHCPMSASRHIRTFPSRMVGIRLKARTVCVYMPKVCTTKLVFLPEAYLAEAVATVFGQTWQLENLVCREKRHGSDLHVPSHGMRHVKKSAYLCLCRVDMCCFRNAGQMGWTSQQWLRNLGTRTSPQQGAFYTHALASSQRRAATCSLIAPTWCEWCRKNNYIINKNNVLSIKLSSAVNVSSLQISSPALRAIC